MELCKNGKIFLKNKLQSTHCFIFIFILEMLKNTHLCTWFANALHTLGHILQMRTFVQVMLNQLRCKVLQLAVAPNHQS